MRVLGDPRRVEAGSLAPELGGGNGTPGGRRSWGQRFHGGARGTAVRTQEAPAAADHAVPRPGPAYATSRSGGAGLRGFLFYSCRGRNRRLVRLLADPGPARSQRTGRRAERRRSEGRGGGRPHPGQGAGARRPARGQRRRRERQGVRPEPEPRNPDPERRPGDAARLDGAAEDVRAGRGRDELRRRRAGAERRQPEGDEARGVLAKAGREGHLAGPARRRAGRRGHRDRPRRLPGRQTGCRAQRGRDVGGQREDDASAGGIRGLVHERPLRLDAGIVSDQSPDGGIQATKGSTVWSRSKSGPSTTTVPDGRPDKQV